MTSKWTNYAENKIADMMRGIPWSLGSNLYVGLANVSGNPPASQELSGSGYARRAMPRALSTWSPTQGGTAPVASSGTSHRISNLVGIDFGVAGSAWGTLTTVEIWDSFTGGNRIAYIPVTFGAINSGDAVNFAVGAIAFTLGLSGGTSDYLANKLLDLFFRGQTYLWPSQTFIALCTSAPNNSAVGGEIPSSGGYARVALASSMVALSGTQGAGTTGASTGTSGTISNNSPITFPQPTTNWGTVTHDMQLDQAAGGNMLFWGALSSAKSVLANSTPPSYGSGNYQTIVD